jgi:hypothetical protein
MRNREYVVSDRPPPPYERGRLRAEEVINDLLDDTYPNKQYATLRDAITNYIYAAYQSLVQAGEVIRDDPDYLEVYREERRGYLSKFCQP